jgi:hypothetical protein
MTVTNVGEQTPVVPILNAGASAHIPVTPEEDAFAASLAARQSALSDAEKRVIAVPRNEEWHATVTGSVNDWIAFCDERGWTPLLIELSNGTVQLMCSTDEDPRPALAQDAAFALIRVKHEVMELRVDEKPLYYEAHLKFDGAYRPDRPGASRDLLRSTQSARGASGRWYLTRRSQVPINLKEFEEFGRIGAKQSVLKGSEAEIVLLDTNPNLDFGWKL